MASGRPFNEGVRDEKEDYIERLFDGIAEDYDLINLVMTGGLLKYWHWVFARLTGYQPGDRVLDVACGTGDLSLLCARQVTPGGAVIGVDIAEEMLRVGRRRIAETPYHEVIDLRHGNALELPFPADHFSGCVTGFALRNVADIPQALSEMARVTVPGGKVLCLELSRPPNRLLRAFHTFHLDRVVPWIGRWAERRFPHMEGLRPYQWLGESLRTHPNQDRLADLFREAGFVDVRYHNLNGGLVCIHTGRVQGAEVEG